MSDELSIFYYQSVKKSVSKILKDKKKKELDICDYYEGRVGGIGYNELRYVSFNKKMQLTFESNNVHNWKYGEDCFKVFYWHQLTDHEKDMLYHVFVVWLDGKGGC